MSKIIIDDLLDETALLNDVNDRFQQVEDELNEKVLYRDNPEGEPNQMNNDLDMNENDILNAKSIDTEQLTVDGVLFDGAVNWGQIGGDIPDQADLEARLQQAEDAGVKTLEVANDHLTSFGLQINDNGNGNFTISYTDAVNGGQDQFTTGEPYGMLRLNSRGKVDMDLLEANALTIIGFYRGDDLCPKNIDGAGIPGLPLTPCGAPDFRNPTQLYGDIFTTGATYVISFLPPEVSGSINLVDPTDPIGPLVPTLVENADLIVYFDEVRIGGTLVVQAGWQIWKGGATVTTAPDTIYDPTGDVIIEPSDINVDLALSKLDTLCDTIANVDTKDAALQLQIDGNVADIIVNGVAITDLDGRVTVNESSITQNIADIAQNTADIAQNAADIATKLPADQFADAGGVQGGIIRTTYDAVTNTLHIQSS